VLRRLDRYLLSELIGPFALGLLVYTFILLIQLLFSLAELIIKRGLPAATVGKLLAYSLPNIFVLTLPMSLLLAVLLGIGRMASDSELVALRASGVSLYRILRPVLLAALVLGGLNTYLMLELLPQGNTAYTRLLLDIATRTLGAQFEPRVFYNEFQGKVLYISDIPAGTSFWHGVLLADSVVTSEKATELVVAERGRLEVSKNGEQVVLNLYDAVQHTYDLTRPDRYETRHSDHVRWVLRDQFASEQRAKMMARKGIRSMNWQEAGAASRDPANPPSYRAQARVQMQKMLSIPAACPIFALLALPLAFSNRRGGKSSGFALSIGIVVAYYVLISQGEKYAIAGRLPPWFAMWLPNLALGGLGLALLVVRDRDRRLLPSWRFGARVWIRFTRRARKMTRGALSRFGVRRADEGDAAPGTAIRRRHARILVRLPRLRLRFPNLVDRYVLKSFGVVVGLVLLSGVALMIVADFTQNVDDILANKPGLSVLLRYYKYVVLQMSYDIAPIAVLVTTLVTYSLLSRTNEVTACKALGISLYRLALPAIAGAVVIGAFFAFLQAQVLPAANQKVAEAQAVIRGAPDRQIARSADRQWQMGRGRFMYNFLNFDARTSTLQRLQVFEFDPKFQLVGRLFAESAHYDPKRGWLLEHGWIRRFDGRAQVAYQPFSGPVQADLDETPRFFEEEARRPDQMSYSELSTYVRELRETGRPDPHYEVVLLNRAAFPVSSIVMALVGLPFAFRLQRRGALYGLGVSIGLGLIFFIVFAFFKTLGEVGALPPIAAVWSPSALFSLLAGYLFLGVRS
jgi:LPS export ABC transporter permease LptF/LPS export ABC transporter permease LptG